LASGTVRPVRMRKLVGFIEIYDIEFQLRFDFGKHGGRGRELSLRLPAIDAIKSGEIREDCRTTAM
jgi:hypothetical protein